MKRSSLYFAQETQDIQESIVSIKDRRTEQQELPVLFGLMQLSGDIRKWGSFLLFQQINEVQQLISLFAQGEYTRAEMGIKKHLNLLTHRADVFDQSRCLYKNITIFQYALWTQNFVMWRMLLNWVVTAEDVDIDYRYAVMAALQSQYEVIKTSGVSYIVDGQRYQGIYQCAVSATVNPDDVASMDERSEEIVREAQACEVAMLIFASLPEQSEERERAKEKAEQIGLVANKTAQLVEMERSLVRHCQARVFDVFSMKS